jgi:hypothetical protein
MMNCMKLPLALLVLALGSPIVPANAQQDSGALRIGNSLQLFVDDYLIESMTGAELKLQAPQPAGVAIKFDKPWEGNVSAYVSVFRDGDKYRMYYRGASAPDYARKSALKPGEVMAPKHSNVTCYAESVDGITWTKPSLGIVAFDGSRDNNITLEGGESSENFGPFLDGNPQAPASERYKAVGGGGKGLFAFKSADGIHWQKVSEQRIITDGVFDSLNVVFWDAERKEYVAIYRDFLQGVRTLKHATSKDFVHWTPGQWADYGDAPVEHLYTNATTPYFRAPQIYLAFPKRYVPWRHVFDDDPEHDGVSEAVFMSSRDGIHWDRRFLEAFVRPGRDPLDWVHRDHMVATGMLATAPDEISIFVSRHYTFPSAFLERMTLRTDGFVSVHAGYQGGSVTTKPLVIDGNELVLNYATSAVGSVQWELLDANGNPVPGFGFAQTTPLSGDEIEHKIRLKNDKRKPCRPDDGACLSTGRQENGLDARPLRLHFLLKDADLYSLQIRQE